MTTIRVKTTIDLTKIEGAAKQFPFAMSKALNETAKLAQLRVQTSLNTRFTIAPSKQEFFRRLIKIPKGGFATKDNLRVELDITGPNTAPGRNNLLKRHILGGTFTMHDPLHPFFVPSKDIRPGPYDLVPSALYPKNLRLQDRQDVSGTLPANVRRTKKGKIVVSSRRKDTKVVKRGDKSFFVVPLDNPLGRTPGIYFRQDGHDDIHLLWKYQFRVRLKPRLPFEQDVQAVFDAQWDKQLARWLDYALKTAK